ncbi:MAG: cation diffusion facilitator family transporter [Proteobacteria bacterium]|nr:cation diffusion facilitator family transporter [Pseudomonadota bacterium]
MTTTALLKEARRVGRVTSLVSAAVNMSLVAIKLVLGTLSGSAALIADGIHSLADLLTDVLTLVTVQIGRTEADDSHPYGHGKFETFGALALAIVLFLTGVFLFYEAAVQLYTHAPLKPLPAYALYAALISVFANEALFRYCLREGKRVNSNVIIANAWHHRADGLSSLAALFGIGLSVAGFPLFDPIAAAAVALVVMKMSVKIGLESFDELVDAAVDTDTQNQINVLITEAAGVRDCHMMRARKLGGHILVDVHVDVDSHISVSEGHLVAERVEHMLKEKVDGVTDVIVHIDPKGGGAVSPHAARRSTLKKHILDTLQAEAPAIKTEPYIVLHYFDHHIETDIILPEADSKPLKKALPFLRKALEKPQGPFQQVRIHLMLKD